MSIVTNIGEIGGERVGEGMYKKNSVLSVQFFSELKTVLNVKLYYSSPSLYIQDTVQDSQWMPDTTIYTTFFPVHIYVIKFNL